MRLQFILILVNIFIIQHKINSQNLQFYREDLTFEIKNDFFYVDGIYNFCNNGDEMVQQILFYPFPIDSLYGAVDSMHAININFESQELILNPSQNGFYFKIDIPPYGVGKYRISYRQKLLSDQAEYILLTTQKWGAPFENALYKLVTPENMKITSTTYDPDSTSQINDKMVYYWSKKDFMPNNNMIFVFD